MTNQNSKLKDRKWLQRHGEIFDGITGFYRDFVAKKSGKRVVLMSGKT